MNISLKSILALCRVSNLPTVWMNVLTAAVLTAHASSQPIAPSLVIMLAVALSAFYCGGMSLNDLCDRHWDKEHQPFRPIPAGRVSVALAWVVTLVLFATGVVLLLLAPNIRGLGAGILLLAVIVAYDRYHKRHPAAVFLMATSRLLVFIVTAEAIAGRPADAVWLAGGLQFGYTLMVTLVARYENSRGKRFSFPVIPRMIAGMAVLDGIVLSLLVSPIWLIAGLTAAVLTHVGQRYVRGD
jgi:4-hydroxybenzoate polyprenyltransferase